MSRGGGSSLKSVVYLALFYHEYLAIFLRLDKLLYQDKGRTL